MPRKVFFSFHFKRDAWRVGQVRNSNIVRREVDGTPFLDKAEWEQIEKAGDPAIKRWIDQQMHGSSITAVLIGTQTAYRRWVRYEIEESWRRGNGLLGIYIHNIKDQFQMTDSRGPNPFDAIPVNGIPMSNYVRFYDWVYNDGYKNINTWIEQAYLDRHG